MQDPLLFWNLYWHYGLPFAKHISIHVHQALTLFSYLVDMEDNSKGSVKEAYLVHIDKIMQCHQICFPNTMLLCHHSRSGTWNISVKANTKGRTVGHIYLFNFKTWQQHTLLVYASLAAMFWIWKQLFVSQCDGRWWQIGKSEEVIALGEYWWFWWLSSILCKGIKVKSMLLYIDYFGLKLVLWYNYML